MTMIEKYLFTALLLISTHLCAQPDSTLSDTIFQPIQEYRPSKIKMEILSYNKPTDQFVSLAADQNMEYPVRVKITKNDTINAYKYLVKFKVISFPPGSVEKSTKLTPESSYTDMNGIAVTYFSCNEPAGRYVIEAETQNGSYAKKYINLDVKNSNWLLLSIIGLLGGLSLFVYGMNQVSRSLQYVAGSHLKKVIARLTDNKVVGMLAGAIATFMMQSSTAFSVMLVGFTTAGVMNFSQSLALLLGSDIGTTLTVQLISFNVGQYALLIITIGFLTYFLGKSKNTSSFGKMIMGVGLIFYGMTVMSEAIQPLKSIPQFADILLSFNNSPFTALLIAAFFTALIHSSAATLGILLSLASQGLVGVELAIPIVFGANLGTCITAAMASIGQTAEAKRVALVNFVFKAAGVILFYPFSFWFGQLITLISADPMRQVANAHTLFNVIYAVLFLPFTSRFARFTCWLLPDKQLSAQDKEIFEPKFLHETLLDSTDLALDHVLRELLRMSEIVDNMFRQVPELLKNNTAEKLDRLIAEDEKIDLLESKIKNYLIRLSENDQNTKQIKMVNTFLFLANSFENMGDLVTHDIYKTIYKMRNEDIKYSEEGLKDLQNFHRVIIEAYRLFIMALRKEDRQTAREVIEIRKFEVDRLEQQYIEAHITRLKSKVKETTESSSRHMEMITSLKRFNSLTNRMAHAIIENFID